jgi:hypothetical protein
MNKYSVTKHYYILCDKGVPRKLSEYSCPTLANLNYKVNSRKRLMVFHTKKSAEFYKNFQIDSPHDDFGYHIRSVDSSDICKLSECFNLNFDFYD